MTGVAPIPKIDYLPRLPRAFRPGIALIGCGGISTNHLRAYRQGGLHVVALCDRIEERARRQRDRFYPTAEVYADYRRVLERDDVQVVDVATHPQERLEILEQAIRAGKHVLSQKPLVFDLREGRRLVELAGEYGVRLAVNQNGRWAPHFRYARRVVEQGWIGQVQSVQMTVCFDHRWVRGTAFERLTHLILLDYGIHWFDIIRVLTGQPPLRVAASVAYAAGQQVRPPLLAQAIVEFPHAQASLLFDGHTAAGHRDQTVITGSRGTIRSEGPGNRVQRLVVHTDQGSWMPQLQGSWFPDAFLGTMGELLCSIEEGRPCDLDARDNLQSLALCFAATASAATHRFVEPGEAIRPVPEP